MQNIQQQIERERARSSGRSENFAGNKMSEAFSLGREGESAVPIGGAGAGARTGAQSRVTESEMKLIGDLGSELDEADQWGVQFPGSQLRSDSIKLPSRGMHSLKTVKELWPGIELAALRSGLDGKPRQFDQVGSSGDCCVGPAALCPFNDWSNEDSSKKACRNSAAPSARPLAPRAGACRMCGRSNPCPNPPKNDARAGREKGSNGKGHEFGFSGGNKTIRGNANGNGIGRHGREGLEGGEGRSGRRHHKSVDLPSAFCNSHTGVSPDRSCCCRSCYSCRLLRQAIDFQNRARIRRLGQNEGQGSMRMGMERNELSASMFARPDSWRPLFLSIAWILIVAVFFAAGVALQR